jgi:CubicO group peptidase (beta-lactamase class C family)
MSLTLDCLKNHQGKKRNWIALCLIAISLTYAREQTLKAAPMNPAPPVVWPQKDWMTASPESQGMSEVLLEKAAQYAFKAGGGSGCIIRHGYLVKEWGARDKLADTKSNAKGTMGTTTLGLALDAGLLKIDDRAQQHYPQMGQEKPENVATGWLPEITVRQMATMTAGFDDGRPPTLVYRPGTKGIYSNDTSNMLAELLTLKFNEDLYPVFKRKVMDPIGVPEDTWKWRENQYRAKTINGLISREFASGLTITPRSMARIGYLYLHEGNWNGKQILSRDFVHMAMTPTTLPAPYSYYGFYWGTNERRTFEGIPRDVYWASGLGDSFVLFCPSLDLVLVRLGTGSKASQLPDDGTDNWGGRTAGLFRLVVDAVEKSGAPPGTTPLTTAQPLTAPYPPSPVIKEIRWAPTNAVIHLANGSDNWPATWADDDDLYATYGDGNGFAPEVPTKLSLGLAKVHGLPPTIEGFNIRSATGEALGDGKKGRKASGLLMVDGVLYMLVRNAGNAHLGWSTDHGLTWAWANWKFTQSFGCPTFLNFGRNYADARDGYVYIYSPDSESAYERVDRMVLARVPKQKIAERAAYEFFKSLDAQGQPVWTDKIEERGAVFTNPGHCYRCGVTYNKLMKRYLWCQTGAGEDPRFRGGLAIYDAPEPWGPWTTVFFTDDWDIGPGDTSSFPTKWMSEGGTRLFLLCSSKDSFAVREATLLPTEPTRKDK